MIAARPRPGRRRRSRGWCRRCSARSPTTTRENALTGLLRTHAAQEVTCVTGYVHDESVKQQASATDKDLATKRVAATEAWLNQQSARGLIVTNYTGDAR